MKLRLLLVLAIVLSVPALGRADDKEEFQKGTWKVTGIASEGKDLPEELVKAINMRFTFGADGKLTNQSEAKKQEGTYKLDSAKKPKEIDLTLDNKDTKGIYDLEGETLKICIGDAERPKDFSTKAGVKSAVFTLKREKP